MRKKYHVRLSADERTLLTDLLTTGTAAARVQTHARILLKADAGPDGPAWIDTDIATALDVGVRTIEDLKGKPILLSDASVGAFWPWLKAKYGFSDDQVRKYTFNSAPFLADKRAAEEGYLTSEPYTLEKQAGFKPVVFLLADNGYPGYANMALAANTLIASNPAAVKAFVEASAKGWRDYLYGDPSAADALIRKDNPEMTEDVLDQARDKMRRFGLVDSGDAKAGGVGAMTDARWKLVFETAASEGLYPKDMDYKRAYTLQFLAK